MKSRMIGALGIAILLSSCGDPPKTKPDSIAKDRVLTVNMQEAADQADALLDGTIKAIHPEVEWSYSTTTSQACTDWKGEATETGAVSRRRAVLTIISDERRGSFLGVVERHWKNSGYRIISVNESETFPAIYAETPEGFRIRLKFGYKGQAHFQASTPCAEQSEVAPPKSAIGGPEYTEEKPPLPNKHSDFWSARTPVPSNGPGEG